MMDEDEAPVSGQLGLFPVVLDLWRSSVPQVVGRGELWFFCGLHLMAWGAFQHGWLAQDSVQSTLAVDWVDLKMLTMISGLLLSFHMHQCLRRYQLICMLTMRMLASVHSIALEARLFLDPKGCQLCSRWLSLAALLTVTRGDPSLRAWRKLVALGLLRRTEAEPLRRMGAARSLFLLQQVAEFCASQVSSGELTEMLHRILVFKDFQQEMLETKRLSLPFQYHHLLTMLIMVNLFLLSYGSALSQSFLSPPVFFAVALLFLSIMEVSLHLWTPVESKSQQLVQEFLWSLHALVYYQHDGPREQWLLELAQELEMPAFAPKGGTERQWI